MKQRALPLALILVCSSSLAVTAAPIPSSFDSIGQDKTAIATLLQTYTDSVTHKNQASFESLLLNKAVPFKKVAGKFRARSDRRRYQVLR